MFQGIHHAAYGSKAAAALGVHQIEPALDALDALLHTVEPSMNASQTFFHVRDPQQIPDVVNETINTLFHARQARLDLLQHGHHKVCDFAHDVRHKCSGDVPQAKQVRPR